ncbi:MAG: hypothetical protein V3T70_02385, partial [Phycisphaerae bacterium]
ARDCNTNGTPDDCDIFGGTSSDVDTNEVPDACEACATPGDMDGNGCVEGDDIQCYVDCLLIGTTVSCGSCVCLNLGLAEFITKLLGAACVPDEPACTVDLDVDTDNTKNTPDFGPQRTAEEDRDEVKPTLPGKYVGINDNDDDNDGLKDYGDGFSITGGPGPKKNDDEADFVRMVLEVPAPTDLTNAKVRFKYNASDPAAAKAAGKPVLVTLPGGNLRIWTKNGNLERSSAQINAATPGHFVASGVVYAASDFGLNNGMRMVDLFLEGIRASGKNPDLITVEVDPDGDGPLKFDACGDAVQVTVFGVDVDIDSDNNDGTGAPDRKAAEDAIEDRSGLAVFPGKMVPVNDDSDDLDKVQDYGDGYNLGAGGEDDVNAAEADFIPLVIEVPKPIDLAKAHLKISYSDSDPAAATIVVTPPSITPAAGRLRVWKKLGTIARDKRSANAAAGNAGDFVKPETYMNLSRLGLSGATRKVTLYVEGIDGSASAAGNEIKVELDPDGSGPAGFRHADAVRVTSVLIDFKFDPKQQYGYDEYRDPPQNAAQSLPPIDYLSVRKGTFRTKTTFKVQITPFVAKRVFFDSAVAATATAAPSVATAAAQIVTVNAKDFAADHQSAKIRSRIGAKDGPIVTELSAEAYKRLVVNEVAYYRILDPGVAATKPKKNPTLAELKQKMNKKYKQGVVNVKKVVGDRKKELAYDKNKNGILDWYPSGADPEVDVITGAGLAGDPKMAYVETIRKNYRLKAAAKKGQKKIELVDVSRLKVGQSYRIGPAIGEPEVVKITGIAGNTITVMVNLAKDHPITDTLYYSLAGLSTDPQLVTDAANELILTIVHEMMHRDAFGNLSDLTDGERDNVMYFTTGVVGDGLMRFRNEEVGNSGNGDPTGALEMQWQALKR